MTTLVAALIGAFLGSIAFTVWPVGPVAGACLGALSAWILQLQQRVQSLEARLLAAAQPVRAARPASMGPVGSGNTEQPEPAADPVGKEPDPYRSPRPARAQTPAPSTMPAFVESRCDGDRHDHSLLSLVGRWLGSGNLPARVGVVLSLFGVGFLIKEAMDRSWLVMPLGYRLLGVGLFGVALLVIGWRLRERRREYAVSLQGGGIAVLYLAVYASLAVYDLLPTLTAFVLLVFVTALAGALSLAQDSRVLAVLGIVGGFLAPILASDGSGRHVQLFGYYAILNVAIVIIAWFRSWRELNVLGFLFTFMIGSVWGYVAYRPEHLSTTEPFLIFFTLIYLVIPILFATRQPPNLKGFVDATLVFGAPLAAFGLQSRLLANTPFGLANSAAVLSLAYAILAAVVFRRGGEMRVLAQSFVGLAVVFFSVTVPLAFDAQWTSVTWAVQGAAMVWLGWRQDRRLTEAAGIALQIAASIAYILRPAALGTGAALLNPAFLGAALVAVAAGISSWSLQRHFEDSGRSVCSIASWIMLGWAVLWWLGAGIGEIDRLVDARFEHNAVLAYVALSVIAALLIAKLSSWSCLGYSGLVLLPALLLTYLRGWLAGHPFAELGFLVWPVALATCYVLARTVERRASQLALVTHVSLYWMCAAVLSAETYWAVDRIGSGFWAQSAVITMLAAFVTATLRMRAGVAWLSNAHGGAYLNPGATCVLAATGVVAGLNNLLSRGDPTPLPFIPLLNPLEMSFALFCGCVAYWFRVARAEGIGRPLSTYEPSAWLSALGLFLVTMSVARTVHHWAGIPFDVGQLAASNVLQASLSIVWGSAALLAMVLGARIGTRTVWLTGAALMSLVVLKLLIVDLGDTDTLGRIVSFLGVGILLLIVGYLAPVPPRAQREACA